MKKCLGIAVIFGLVLGFAGIALGDTTTVAVSANVVGTCKFQVGGTMSFGALDPDSGADVIAVVTQPRFWCTNRAAYTITDDDGLYWDGTSHRVKNAALNEYIPYTFTYTTTGTGLGKNSPITMDIAGQILGVDYVGAPEGAYSDTVTLTITP